MLSPTLDRLTTPLQAPPYQSVCALLAALLSLLAGCSEPSSPTPSRPQGAVLILVDTLRPDRLGSYGHPRNTSPNLDRLAAQGVRFEQAVSAAPWTMPSVAALLAGRSPEAAFNRKLRLKSSLIESFQTAGLQTAAFTEGAFVSKHFDMDRGFDTFSEESGAFHAVVSGKRLNAKQPLVGGVARTFSQARQWLAQHGDSPFLLVIHTYEVHTPYERPRFTQGEGGRIGDHFDIELLRATERGEIKLTEQEREHIRRLYDGGIASTDRHIGNFLGFLDELGLRESTVVAVTSDHGEELGEHPEHLAFDHGHSLKDNLLLVPLIIHDPTRSWAVKTVSTQVRSIDILPTLAELLSVELETPAAPVADKPGRGASLVPLMTGEETAHRIAVSSQVQKGGRAESLRDGRFKLITPLVGVASQSPPDMEEPRLVQLYDLEQDPTESHNLASERPDLVLSMQAWLAQWHLRGTPLQGAEESGSGPLDVQPQAMDEEHLEQLRALGYLK